MDTETALEILRRYKAQRDAAAAGMQGAGLTDREIADWRARTATEWDTATPESLRGGGRGGSTANQRALEELLRRKGALQTIARR